jgi:hypothetical protein
MMVGAPDEIPIGHLKNTIQKIYRLCRFTR